MAYTERVVALLDPELLERVRKEAEARGLGVSALVRVALIALFNGDRKLVDAKTSYEVQRD